jgi:serine/threonine protein kinase
LKKNICITGDDKVQVTDIAVNTQVRQTISGDSQSVPSKWMYKPSEELEYGIRTTQTDVYSFATTIYSVWIPFGSYDQPTDSPFQMYTLKPPFPSNIHSYGKGLKQIMGQGHDGTFGRFKPAEMNEELWKIIRMCWAVDPSCRPSMIEVEARLGNIRKAN